MLTTWKKWPPEYDDPLKILIPENLDALKILKTENFEILKVLTHWKLGNPQFVYY